MAYSSETVVSDGTLTTHNIAIDYQEREDIHVYFDDVEDAYGWVWVGATEKTIDFSTTIPLGVVVRIQRETELDLPRHVFGPRDQGGSAQFTDRAIDENFDQFLKIAQEARETAETNVDFLEGRMQSVEADTAEALDTANDALDQSGTALTQSGTALTQSAQAADDAAQAVQDVQGATDAAEAATVAANAANAAAAAAQQAAEDAAGAIDPRPELLDTVDPTHGSAMVGYRGPYLVKNKLGETVSAEEYWSATDNSDSEAAQRALDAVGYGGTVLLTKPRYDFATSVDVWTSRTSIVAPNGARIDIHLSPSNNNGAIRFRGGEALAGQITSVVADIALGDTVIHVDNAVDLDVARGDYIRLISAEYFNGIAGMSGYGLKTKGEWMQVVSLTGNTITILGGAKDSYTLALGAATVQKATVSTLFALHNIEFYGTGGGNAHTTANPVGPRAFTASYVDGLVFGNVTTRNCPRTAVGLMNGMNAFAFNYSQTGYDTEDASNFPSLSNWFTGINLQGWENFALTGGQARNCRRILDADTIDLVTRNVSLNGIQAYNCHNLVGCHVMENFSVSNAQGYMCGAISSRAKNTSLSNITNVQNRGDIAVHLGHVGTVNRAYSEHTSVGVVKMRDISVTGVYQYGVAILGNSEDVQAGGLYLPGATSTGVYVNGKRHGNIAVEGTVKGRFNMVSQTDMPCEEAGTVNLRINFLDGGPAECIRIAGTTSPSSRLNVLVDGCTFAGGSSYAASFGLYSGESGYFPRSPVFGGNNVYMHAGLGANPQPVRTLRYASPAPIVAGFTGTRVSPCQWGQLQNSSTPLFSGTYYPGAKFPYQTYPGGGSGGYIGKNIRTAGTIGSLPGATASTNSGSSTITVNDPEERLAPGAYIAVAGALTYARVTSINGNVVTTTQSATATVTDAAMTFVAPTFSEYAELT